MERVRVKKDRKIERETEREKKEETRESRRGQKKRPSMNRKRELESQRDRELGYGQAKP